MASKLHYQGDAAIYSAISRLLMRGYNPAKPLYDEADSDDFWIKGPNGDILRCQAKSATVKNWRKKRINGTWEESRESKSAGIQLPQSILTGGVDIIAVCFRIEDQFLVGLFDAEDIAQLHVKEGRGGTSNRKPKNGKISHSETIGFKWSVDYSDIIPKIKFSGGRDVTQHFVSQGGRWDELFPSKYPT